MWLLDKNVPVQLQELLRELGVEAVTADSKGFGNLANGELVSSAAAIGVVCILTRDMLFAQSAKKSLQVHKNLCVVVLTLPQLRAPGFLSAFRAAWSRADIRLVEGQVVFWPGKTSSLESV